VIVVLVLCFVYLVYRFRYNNCIPLGVEDHVNGVLANSIDSTYEDHVFFPVGISPTRFQAHVVRVTKVEFGFLKRTKANRLMVRKFIRDLMRDHGMRPTHIHQHLDLCVAIFFIPSNIDIMVEQVNASAGALERDREMRTSWTSMFDRLGGMLKFTEE